MILKYFFNTSTGISSYTRDFKDVPTECTHCKHQVNFISHYGIHNKAGYSFFVECPKCNICSTLYSKEENTPLSNLNHSLEHLNFSVNIQELSPKFCLIYNQSHNAKKLNLNEIVGIGLGKAVEQLVYDYLIKVQNDKPVFNFSQNIKKLNNFNDATIQLTLAKFVRNDETHPQKESDFCLEDLIESVKYIVIFFEAKYATFKLSQKLLINNAKKE